MSNFNKFKYSSGPVLGLIVGGRGQIANLGKNPQVNLIIIRE